MAISILVVEDQDADFEAVERGLRRLNVQNVVVRCSDAEDALDFLFARGAYGGLQRAQPPDMILLDLTLHDTDGREVLALIKQDDYLKTIPVIVWTASTDPRDVETCYRLGANSLVRKTFDFAEVNRALERFVHFWLETAVLPHASATRLS